MSETPEERKKRFDDLRESIAAELLEKYPEATFNRHKYGINVIHYTAYFHDKVCIKRCERSINTSAFSLSPYFLTEEAAREAINKQLPAAQEKFEKCLAAFEGLCTEMGFDVSYCIEGDTHGVSDYPYISFEMGGFQFTWTIPN